MYVCVCESVSVSPFVYLNYYTHAEKGTYAGKHTHGSSLFVGN